MVYFCRYMKRAPDLGKLYRSVLLAGLILLAWSPFHSSAQPVTKGAVKNTSGRLLFVIDTLNTRVIRLRASNDSLYRELGSLNSRMAAADSQIARLTQRNNQLRSELTDAVSRGMQSSHTSSVLLVFNVIVALFLVVALVWMWFRRRPSAPESVTASGQTGRVNELSTLDQKLEFIQKLGVLRDKGLLTAEEFDLQKKQLLGEL